MSAAILICDSDPSFLRWAEEMLFAEDYQVETATCASEFVQKLLHKKFESTILSTNIEGMDWLEVISIAKQIDNNIPIIVTTECNSLETERKARMQSIFYYFVKPVNPDEMKEVLRDAVVRRTARQNTNSYWQTTVLDR